MSRYPLIERPLDINGCTIRNRIVRAAHGTLLAFPNGFVIGDDLIAYHVERARNGVALSILETANVHPSSFGAIQAFLPGNDEGWYRLARACNAEGMKVFQQLYHGGSTRGATGDGKGAWSASGGPVPCHTDPAVPMTKGMIDEAIEAYVSVARRCKAAGIDGVELHAAHGYLVHEFLSPLSNRRTDDYGGPLENRMRFLLEILGAMRNELGPDYPIGVRLSASELSPGGLEPPDIVKVVERLQDDRLIDFLDVSLATYASPDMQVAAMHEPVGYERPWADPVARAARVPTFINGRFNTLQEAEDLLASGVCEMVSIVRGLIADPQLITKSLAGREDEVRPCIGCNQQCIGGVNVFPPRMTCVVNVEAGLELTAQPIATSENPGRVLVVGAGPSGLEAARTAALRGHKVELHAADDAPGGNIRFARRAPYRADIGKIIDYQLRELDRLGVDIRLNSKLDAAAIVAIGADHVILATGQEPRRDGLQRFFQLPVQGAHLSHVRSMVEVLGGAGDDASHALIFDDLGTYPAVAVTEYLLSRGKKVTFASSHNAVAEKLAPAFNQRPHVARLSAYDAFTFLPYQSVVEIRAGSARLRQIGTEIERTIDADLVTFCGVGEPRDALHAELQALGMASTLTGDASGRFDLGHAIRSGHEAAMAI